MNELKELKEQKEFVLKQEKRTCGYINATKEELLQVYKNAQDILDNGDFESKKALIQSYLNRIAVFQNHVEVYINTIPTEQLCGVDIDVTKQEFLHS